jgi:hypothetical protein
MRYTQRMDGNALNQPTIRRASDRAIFCRRLEGEEVLDIAKDLGLSRRHILAMHDRYLNYLIATIDRRMGWKPPKVTTYGPQASGFLADYPGDIVARIAALFPSDLVAIRECGGDAAIEALAGTPRTNYPIDQVAKLRAQLLETARAGLLIGATPLVTIHAHLAVGSRGRPKARVLARAA